MSEFTQQLSCFSPAVEGEGKDEEASGDRNLRVADEKQKGEISPKTMQKYIQQGARPKNRNRETHKTKKGTNELESFKSSISLLSRCNFFQVGHLTRGKDIKVGRKQTKH